MREVRQLAEQEERYSINSPLLFGALAALDPEKRIEVMDLSPANPQLIEYFNQYHCKLYLPACRDALLELTSRNQAAETEDEAKPVLDAEVRSCLQTGTEINMPLNVILLWDLPNYLDKRVLSELIAQLAKFSDPNTVLHIYIHTRQSMPDRPADYRLMPDNRIMAKMPGQWHTDCPMYYQELLHKVMAPFRVVRGMLLSNGLQEYILRPQAKVS